VEAARGDTFATKEGESDARQENDLLQSEVPIGLFWTAC
jgi:hypothetical protein